MLWTVIALLFGMYLLLAILLGRREDLGRSAYPSPEAADQEMCTLVERYPERCRMEIIGQSTEGRALRAFCIHAPGREPGGRPRLLLTAHIHAVEFVGSFVARAVARSLVEGFGRDAQVSALLEAADVWMVPLLNPDGAVRVWRHNGCRHFGNARFTASGVDPNRNFPFKPMLGRCAKNSASERPGSPYYRGPQPLSEPECRALAQLCARERFCAAINFHSFGGVVFMPEVDDHEVPADVIRAFDVFRGCFQSHQRHLRYRPVSERLSAIAGQLDLFLLLAFGTASVTVEVSRPGLAVLHPARVLNLFWWANPPDPLHWVDNDARATRIALAELLARTGGRPYRAAAPELAGEIAASGAAPR